jgi:ATP-dependent DNA helicase RecG
MTSIKTIESWLKRPEGQNLEFKAARNSFSQNKDLPDYCAALANEGGGQLILGIEDKTHIIVGTNAFLGNHNRLSHDLITKIRIRIDVEEIIFPQGRILIFHVPAHHPGQPVQSTGNYKYPMRAGESLIEMDLGTLKRILNEVDLKQTTKAKCRPKSLKTKLLEDAKAVEELKEYWYAQVPGYTLTRQGLQDLKKYYLEFGRDEVVCSIDIACARYLKYNEGVLTAESTENTWKKIGGICYCRKTGDSYIHYIKGILKNRCRYFNEDHAKELLEKAVNNGIAVEELKTMAKKANSWSQWRKNMEFLIAR